MKILVSGSSGFVGNALVTHLKGAGHETWRLVRNSATAENTIRWDPASGQIDAAACERFEAVVHLGGENIAAGRWTRRRKKRLRKSRVNSTRFLALTLSQLQQPPKVFACASAIGIYGDRGKEKLTESATPGEGFLADISREWEQACEPAATRGIRVVNYRLGIVLGKGGGALAKMLPIFRFGLGGKIGNGRQYWSWISLADTVRAMTFCLESEKVSGPVNMVSPIPLTNREFTKTLGCSLHRPTLLPLPAFVARIVLGEMADAALLASARVLPTALTAAGFDFRHVDLGDAFASAI